MKTPILILILVNNKETFPACVQSLLPLEAEILVINTSGEEITGNFKIVNLKPKPRAKLCNEILAQTPAGWHFYIKASERLVAGSDEITDLVLDNAAPAYNVQILENNVIKKETRLWLKSKEISFQNNYSEMIRAKNPINSGITLLAGPDLEQNNNLKNIKINSLEKDSYYYKALSCLKEKDFDEFKRLTEYYLFYVNDLTVSTTMLRYYLAMIQTLHNKDHEAAIRTTVECLRAYPLMAEFWCLLGDIFFQNYEFQKAKSLYENAVLLGKQRSFDDYWPIHIDKYGEYPDKMIQKCSSVLTQSFPIRSKPQ